MQAWSDRGSLACGGMWREAFFFSAGGVQLFGSTYAAEVPSSPLGVVICNSWGFEANQAGRLVHPFSIAVARAGGVAVNFHYPGFGDSQGDPDAVTLADMADASVEALREAARRYPQSRWVLAGLMLGGSVASLAAARSADFEHLLLVQPSLRPQRYFARLQRAAKRSRDDLGPAEGFAYGYRLSKAILDSAAEADAEVEAALAEFSGSGTILAFAEPAGNGSEPAGFERVSVPGAWRFGAGTKDHKALGHAAGAWARGRVEGEAPA